MFKKEWEELWPVLMRTNVQFINSTAVEMVHSFKFLHISSILKWTINVTKILNNILAMSGRFHYLSAGSFLQVWWRVKLHFAITTQY